jgi:hypothetical protein
MTRKVVGAAGVLLGLICLMGANTISYAPNNPIGGKGTINASGSYTTDPGQQFPASEIRLETLEFMDFSPVSATLIC